MSLYGVTRPQWVKMKICSSVLLSIFYKSHHQCFMQWVGTDFTLSPTQANNHQDLPHNLQSINTDVLFMKKQLIWLFESRKSVRYWWSYTSFAPECKELTCMLDPLLYRWGVPPVVISCVHWTMQKGVLQNCMLTPQSPAIIMGPVAIFSEAASGIRVGCQSFTFFRLHIRALP